MYGYYGRATLGVDIDDTKIHIVKMRRRLKRAVIVDAFTAPLLSTERDRYWENLTQVLSMLVQQHHLVQCRAIGFLPAKLVKTGHILLPLGLSAQEIADEIKNQLTHDSLTHAEEVAINYTQIKKLQGECVVYFNAVQAQQVTFYTNCFLKAGLALKALETDSVAIIRAAKLLLPPLKITAEKEVHALFYFNGSSAKWIIYDEKVVLLSQQESFLTTDATVTDWCMQRFAEYKDQSGIVVTRLGVCCPPVYRHLFAEVLFTPHTIHYLDTLSPVWAAKESFLQDLPCPSLSFLPAFGASLKESK